MRTFRPNRRRGAFTLVELLVVIGIIAMLLSMLLPSLTGAMAKAKSVTCASNLRQCYAAMLMYSQNNRDILFPTGLGWNANRKPAPLTMDERWPAIVFGTHKGNPPEMTCPSDPEPFQEHSYVVNNHMAERGLKVTRTGEYRAYDIILIGEKKTTEGDYYMEVSEFDRIAEMYRHGLQLGSNYLFLDGHIEMLLRKDALKKLDPWDPAPVGAPPSNVADNEGTDAPNTPVVPPPTTPPTPTP